MIYKEYFIGLNYENKKHYENYQLVRIMPKSVKNK